MKTKKLAIPFLLLILSLVLVLLTGCGQSAASDESGKLDVTQAYQTIEARLTEAVAQTQVPATVTQTIEPSATPSQEPTLQATTPAAPSATFLPTFTHTPATRCDRADAAYPSIDITIPDDTEIPTGNTFTKVWRLVNTGTCNWTADYAAIFVSGEQLGAPAKVAISKPVAPGQSVDISVNMQAPSAAGTYRGYWKLQNAKGEQFGIGTSGNEAFWLQIVAITAAVSTPTATAAPTPQTLVSGPVSLNANASLDLDTLQLGGGGSDLAYQPISDGTNITGHQLVPQAGASAGVFGVGQPTYSQCQNAGKSAAPIDLVANSSGTYLCYLTNQGLTGWARLDALDDTNQVLSITILTWAGQ